MSKVEPPLRDEMFDAGDEHALDLDHDDLVAEAMSLYAVSRDEAEDRVLKDRFGVASDVARRWT